MTAAELAELVAVVLVGLYLGVVGIAGAILLVVSVVGRFLDRAAAGHDDTVDAPPAGPFWPYPPHRPAAPTRDHPDRRDPLAVAEAAIAGARYAKHRDDVIVAAAVANLDDELVALLTNPNPTKDTEP